jgi:hypothetical protein
MPGQVVQHNDTKADGNKEHSAKEVSHGLSHHTILRFKRAWVSRPLSGKMTLARFPEFDLAPNRWSGRGSLVG